MPYIEFTESQKQRAASVDLEVFLLFLFWGRGADFPLFAVQEPGHGLGVAEVIELLDKRDWPAALLGGVVEPLVSPDGDTVVAGKAFFSAAGQEFFSLRKKEHLQIYGGGPLLLIVGKFNTGHCVLLIFVVRDIVR